MTQSARRALTSLARCAAFAVVAHAALGGCGMSSLTSGIGGGWFGSKKSTKTEVGTVNEDQLLAAAKTDSGSIGSIGGEVAHGCPRFQVWSRDGYVTIYEQGRVGDGAGRHAPRRDHQDGARMPDRARPRHREIRLLRPRAAGPERQVRPRDAAAQRVRLRRQAREGGDRQGAASMSTSPSTSRSATSRSCAR